MRKRNTKPAKNFLLIILLLCLAPATYAMGQPAPDFTLPDLDGRQTSLKDFRGRISVLAFISAKCPISNAYRERLRMLAADYELRNVAFIGINSSADESVDEIRAHAMKSGFKFTILRDEGNVVADAYGAVRTPTVYVLDAEGTLRYQGRIDNSQNPKLVRRRDLRIALDEMLAGRPISRAEGKAFGCLIKRVQDAGPAAVTATAKNDFEPKVGLLKPADFVKFKQAALGKVLVINFWATWCGPCVAEFPEFVHLDAKYKDQGVRFVGISADELTDLKTKVIPFIKEQKAMFEMVIQDTDDPEEMMAVVDKNWPGTLPATFVFDKQGNLTYARYGIIDRDLLVEAIEKARK